MRVLKSRMGKTPRKRIHKKRKPKVGTGFIMLLINTENFDIIPSGTYPTGDNGCYGESLP